MSTSTQLVILAALVGGGLLLWQKQKQPEEQAVIPIGDIIDSYLYDRLVTQNLSEADLAKRKKAIEWTNSHTDYVWRVNKAWELSNRTEADFDRKYWELQGMTEATYRGLG